MSAIDEYLNTVDPPQRAALERIRAIVKEMVPDAEEQISYGIPAFKYHKKPLIYFAAFKSHMSIFPTAGPPEELKEKLKDFTVSKGTIQFTIEKPIPENLVKEIISSRLKTIATELSK